MASTISWQTVAFVAVVAVAGPVVIRLASSPVALLLLFPVIATVLALTFIVLHVLLGHALDKRKVHNSHSLHDAARPFSFSTPAAWQAVVTRSQWSESTTASQAPLIPTSPEISDAFNDILSLIIRDFLMVWYKEISSSSSFPAAVSSLIRSCVDKLLERGAIIDIPSLLVNRILPKVTMHVELFRQSEVALRGAGLERRLTQSEELDLLLANKYSSAKDSGKLHSAVENLSTMFTRQTEEMHLRKLVDRALPFILPKTEAASRGVKIVAREIVACAVLYPVMEMLGDPDFWNRMIDEVVCPTSIFLRAAR
jgi:sorting nexin-25